MSTYKLKTSAKCEGCVTSIGNSLNKRLKPEQWNIDLSTPDKVLTVETDLPVSTIIKLVEEAGHKATEV